MPKYANRSDLRDVPTYGDKTKRADAQRAVPIGKPPTSNVAGQQNKYTAPGSLPDILRATEHPDQPITAGADFGEGMSALQAGIPQRSDGQMAMDEIRAIIKLYPNQDLLNMLDRFGAN